MKRALWAAAAVAVALVTAVAGSAATLPGGTSISAAITSPADGAVVSSTASVPISATGSVGIGQAVANTTLVYIVDVSGSTTTPTGGTNCPNQNVYDTLANTTLDCELLAIRNLNGAAIQQGTVASIGLIGFGGNTFDEAPTTITDAFNVDLSAGTGVQTLVAPNLLDFSPGTRFALNSPATNLDWAVNSFWVGSASIVVPPGWTAPPGGSSGFSLFTQRAFNYNTNYAAALLTFKNMLSSITTPHISVVMVSDGDSTIGVSGNPVGTILNTITAPGKTISFSTFAVGASASCGSPTTTDPYGTLAQISAHFGQACQALSDPQQAITAVPAIISSKLTGLNVSVDGTNVPRTINPPLTLPANGPATVTASATSPILAVGDHSFCANASGTDGGGSGASGDSCITVHAKAPPVLTLTGGDGTNGYAATRDEGSSFDVGATVANGFTSAQWTASGGTGTCTFADPTALNTSVTCDDDGVYALTLTVHDDAIPRQSDTATEHLNVVNVAPTPSLTLTPSSVPLAAPAVHAHADIADPGADTWTCTFNWGDGSAVSTVDPQGTRGCDADHTYTSPGAFHVTVHVADDDGGTGDDSATATVKAPPTLTGLPHDDGTGIAGTVAEGSAFPLTGTIAGATSVDWSASLSGPGHCTFAGTPAASMTCDDNGTATVTVVATDDFGQSNSATFHVVVTNVAPSFTISSPTTGSSSRSVTFTALASDVGANDTLTCTIDWGDGTVDVIPLGGSVGTCNGSHTYGSSAAGATITAWATDDDGADSTHRSVSLTFNRPPVCSAVSVNGTAALWPVNHKLVLVGLTGATDPDQDPLTYAITGVTQDEPVTGGGSGSTLYDAKLASGGSVYLRSERAGSGDGRVYRIAYTVSDGSLSCGGTVVVKVPHDQNHPAVDSGGTYNSFG